MVCDFMFDGMVVVQGCITAGNSRKIASKPVLERERREGLGDDICAVMPWTFNCVSVLERSLCLLSTSKRKSALRMGFLKSAMMKFHRKFHRNILQTSRSSVSDRLPKVRIEVPLPTG